MYEWFLKLVSLRRFKFTGAKGEIMYSKPSFFLISLLYPYASSHIFCSDAYWVEVSKYVLWFSYYFKCLIFCLQFNICQHLMQRTSLFDFVLMRFSLSMKSFHSGELRLIIFICRVIFKFCDVL